MQSAIVKGLKEVNDVSNQEMLDLMDITDEIRKQIGKRPDLLACLLRQRALMHEDESRGL